MTKPNPFQLLFPKKKQHVPLDDERHPINLPEIPKEKINTKDIEGLLNSGIAIMAWYDILKKFNIHAGENYAGNTNTLALYRVEEGYLVKYKCIVEYEEMYARLSEIMRMNASNIERLINEDLHDAYRIYMDEDGLTHNINSYVHDVTVEMIEEELQTKRIMYVTEEHFLKKADVK